MKIELTEIMPDRDGRRFSAFWGEVFEEYVNWLVGINAGKEKNQSALVLHGTCNLAVVSTGSPQIAQSGYGPPHLAQRY
jgi:hypothetical protein